MNNDKYFKEIFHKNHTNLLRLAYSFVRSEEVAEELVQDIFITIWQKKIRISTIDSIESYLHTSVKNKCLNYLKSKYHRDHSGFLELDSSTLPYSHSEDELEEKELAKVIEKGISLLPEKCRIIFVLSRDQDMPYQKIADILGVSKETIKSQIKIAIRKLKEHLNKNDFNFFQ